MILDFFDQESNPNKPIIEHPRRKPEELSLDDIEPWLIKVFCTRRADKERVSHDDNLKWMSVKGFDVDEAEKTLQALYRLCRWPPKTSESRPPSTSGSRFPGQAQEITGKEIPAKPKGRPEKQLTSGVIENFHQKYRGFKEQQRILGHPENEPQAHHVREWLRPTGHNDEILYRWATELLEKHRP